MKFAQNSIAHFNYTFKYAICKLGALGYEGIEFWGGLPNM